MHLGKLFESRPQVQDQWQRIYFQIEWSTGPVREDWGQGECLAWRRDGCGSSLPIPTGNPVRRWSHPYIVVCSGRMKERRQKVLMTSKGKTSTMRPAKQCLYTQICAPFLEVFQATADKTLNNLVWAQHWPYFEYEIGVETPWVCIHTNYSMFLWF